MRTLSIRRFWPTSAQLTLPHRGQAPTAWPSTSRRAWEHSGLIDGQLASVRVEGVFRGELAEGGGRRPAELDGGLPVAVAGFRGGGQPRLGGLLLLPVKDSP